MDVLKPVMYIKEKNSRAGKGLTTQLCYISPSAVARLDLLQGVGGGNSESLGGSGGMLPRKILNYRVSEIAFSAFGEH